MDHKYIAELDMVDRYLMGRLTAEEISEFEEHFVDCADCVGQLTSTKALIDGLRVVAAEDVPVRRDRVTLPLPGWLRPTGVIRAAALATSILLVAVGIVLVVGEIRRSRVERESAAIASVEWQRRYEEERQSASSAEARHQNTENELKSEVARLRAELDNQADENIVKPGAYTRPQINFKTVVLKSTRSGESS